MEHKIATYRHHITRINSLPLTPKQKQTEWTLIQLITQNSSFPQKLVQNLNLQIQHKNNLDQTNGKNKNKNWTNFTYYSPRIRKITNLFKHTNIGISFKSTNTQEQLTKPKLASNTQEQDKSGIYKLTCNTCQTLCIGQISRSLKHQEHVKIYKTHSEPQLAYALHILNNKQEYGPINNTMTLLKHINKTPLITIQTTIYPIIPPTQAAYFRTIHR
jgi:hypothetical protein